MSHAKQGYMGRLARRVIRIREMENTMSIQRWDPWRDIVSLREAMNSLLEESFVRPRAGMVAITGGMAPPVGDR